jgi:hypothetical protein
MCDAMLHSRGLRFILAFGSMLSCRKESQTCRVGGEDIPFECTGIKLNLEKSMESKMQERGSNSRASSECDLKPGLLPLYSVPSFKEKALSL